MNDIYYFDEAGFTGSDLSNADQPYFCLVSARFTDNEILQIKNDLSLQDDTELHFKKLYKSPSGQKRILALLGHPLMDKKHIKIGIALKRYCVYAQIVDVLIETGSAYHRGNRLVPETGDPDHWNAVSSHSTVLA